MQNLILYTAVTAAGIFTPGPGILFTLTNTLNYRFNHALYSVAGIVLASAIIGAVAASGLGVILTTSPSIMTIMTILGSAYLFYMGVKLFKSKPKTLKNGEIGLVVPTRHKLFSQGFILTFVNPKPIIFYLVVFPQFVDPTQPVATQFAILIAISIMLIFMSHCAYGYFASIVRKKLSNENFFTTVNRVAGIIFMGFGGALALSIIN